MESDVTSVLRAATAPWSPWTAIRSRPARVVLGSGAFLLAYAVAYHFGIAEGTVSSRLARAERKLGVSGRTELARIFGSSPSASATEPDA